MSLRLINNISERVVDDLKVRMSNGSHVSIAAASFSIYAFEALKKELEKVEQLRFIFTSPTFVSECGSKEKREFFIPKLNRKTVAEILSKIKPSKFGMYATNPEEFIQKISRLILEQKATIIVERISYNQVDGEYSSDIFTQEKHAALDKAYEGKKSIVDYVFTDGSSKNSIERQFVEQLDAAKEVIVYAKLPKGFHIPTPVGNYSPDWAIAFEEGTVKHIYFVAETKGSMSSLDLRGIESGKIACAEKLFKQLSTSDVHYGKIDSFDQLMTLVR